MAERPVLNVLRNADEVLRLLAERVEATPSELAAATGIPRSTIYRIVEGLATISFVATDAATGRIRLSQRWLSLGDAARRSQAEWTSARAVMRAVAEQTGYTTYLTIRDVDRALCIDWVQGQAFTVLMLRPGRSLPYHAGAAGRALLATLPDDDLDAYLASCARPPLTPATIVTAEALRADVRRTRSQGHAVSLEDVTIGAGAVGVPVVDDTGTRVGCISLGGLAGSIEADLAKLVAALKSASARILWSPSTKKS